MNRRRGARLARRWKNIAYVRVRLLATYENAPENTANESDRKLPRRRESSRTGFSEPLPVCRADLLLLGGRHNRAHTSPRFEFPVTPSPRGAAVRGRISSRGAARYAANNDRDIADKRGRHCSAIVIPGCRGIIRDKIRARALLKRERRENGRGSAREKKVAVS